MKVIKYITQDGFILLNKNGNTYLGRHANDILMIFIRHQINTYKNQKDVLNFAVKENKLIKEQL
jgi:hypothetical protein